MRVSVVIPTLDRGELLVATIEHLLAQSRAPDEIVIVDQTERHPPQVAAQLEALARREMIKLLKRDAPSIPAAMNDGVANAVGDVVLFVDDDVVPDAQLVDRHVARHAADDVAIVAGRVLQPWHDVDAVREADDLIARAMTPDEFPFHARSRAEVTRFIGCNVSMRRDWIVTVGGFDENFFGAAYRFEADFAARVRSAGGRVVFEPSAVVNHLHHAGGGTRSFGDHLRTAGPWHSAGRWYYLMRHPSTPGIVRTTLGEARRSVIARQHLRRPWRIVVSLSAELTGLACAAVFALRGPRLTLKLRGVA